MRRRPLKPFRRPVRIHAERLRDDPRLLKAHHFFNNGEYGEAGLIYLDLAQQAELRELPITPDLFMRVVACKMRLGKYEEAFKLTFHVFEWLKIRKRYRKIRILVDNISRNLKIAGQEDMLIEINEWIDENIPSEIQTSDNWSFNEGEVRKTNDLPAHCASCGAPTDPAELEWFDNSTPICGFCGCIIEKKEID